MYTRSELRHACYRAKNNAVTPDKQPLLDVVAPHIPPRESWSTFADKWDIFLDKENNIRIVKPEIDFEFITTTCLKYSIYKQNGIAPELSDREQNVIEIVELNMLEGKMKWEDFSKTWGVEIDMPLKHIKTKLFKTFVNEVVFRAEPEPTEPIIPLAIVADDFKPVSLEEQAVLEKLLKHTK